MRKYKSDQNLQENKSSYISDIFVTCKNSCMKKELFDCLMSASFFHVTFFLFYEKKEKKH